MNTPDSSRQYPTRAGTLGIIALAALLFCAGCIVVPAHPNYQRPHHCHHNCR